MIRDGAVKVLRANKSLYFRITRTSYFFHQSTARQCHAQQTAATGEMTLE